LAQNHTHSDTQESRTVPWLWVTNWIRRRLINNTHLTQGKQQKLSLKKYFKKIIYIYNILNTISFSYIWFLVTFHAHLQQSFILVVGCNSYVDDAVVFVIISFNISCCCCCSICTLVFKPHSNKNYQKKELNTGTSNSYPSLYYL